MERFDKYLKRSSKAIPILLGIVVIGAIGVFLYDLIIREKVEVAFSTLPFIVITLLFIGLYYLSRGIFKTRLAVVNDEYFYLAVIFAFLAVYLGSYLNFYERFSWWDTLLHFSSGIILGFFGISIISVFFGRSVDEKGDIYIMLAFGILISQGIGVFWEFYEYSFDFLFDSNMQRTIMIENVNEVTALLSPKGYLRDPGLNDTMKDLFLATIGAIIAAVISYPRFKHHYPKIFSKNKIIPAGEIKYIAIDMDGTLLNSKHEISPVNFRAIKKAQEAGYKIILCSGRATRNMRQYAEQLGLYENGDFIVSYNGAKAYFLNADKTEELLFEVDFLENETKGIYDLVGQYGKNYVTYSTHGTHARDVELLKERYKGNIEGTPDNILIGSDLMKVIIQDSEQNINEIYDEVSDKIKDRYPHLNIFTSTKDSIEITPAEAAKGIGLRKLFSLIDAQPDNLICFGDQNNDVSMFKYAKYSVAMNNATSELKKESTHTTFSNDKDGVGLFIEHKVLHHRKVKKSKNS